MNDPWIEWENDPRALALLDSYTGQGSTAIPRRDTESWLEASKDQIPQTEPDPSAWEITSHAALIALGWIEIASTEASARGKPSGYKVTAQGLLKKPQKPNQDNSVDAIKG